MIVSASEVFDKDFSRVPHFQSLSELDRISASVHFSQKLSSELFGSGKFISPSNLQDFLGARIDQFILDCNAMRHAGESEKDVAKRNRWIFADFLSPLKAAGKIFADVTKLENTQWCLSFDELELSHPDIRNLLFTYLRGADPLFYFKLATIPFIEDLSVFQSMNAPTGHHDYSVVELWRVKKEDGDQFMRSLASSVLRHNELKDISLDTVLGSSHSSSTSSEGPIEKFSFGSRFFDRFTALSDDDPTFRDYLQKKGIGVRDFFQMSEEQRAANFRKIQNIVEIRSAFWQKESAPKLRKNRNQKRTSRRPRNRGFAYSGANNIIEMCDNNPRFLLAVLGPLITTYKRTSVVVGAQQQLDSLLEVSKQIDSVLDSEGLQSRYAGMLTVHDLLDRVGRYFRNQIHGPYFTPDPVLSFKIGRDEPPALIKAIGFAIREGAMLLEGEYSGSYFRDGLANKRVRLSYIFASKYLLPIMLGRSNQIELILRPRKSFHYRKDDASNRDLFSEK